MNETYRIETVVTGAGVIGLAIARALARSGQEVIVLEEQHAIGTETSSRNSEVIHAGIYYPKDSLKARLCVAGKHMLYEFLATHGVPHRRCGKLIVAARAEESGALSDIAARAQANGVPDLEPLSRAQALALEPALACTEALLSPSTGILDVHGYMLSLEGEIEDAGGSIALGTPLLGAEKTEDGFLLRLGDADGFRLACRNLVLACGLHARKAALSVDAMPADLVPPAYYARGNYFSYAGRSPFSRLIYPVPEPGGLGTHLTLDMGGQARFGPDVEWIDAIDYEVDPARGETFYAAIRRYWPALPDGALQPAYSGIRPKISGPDEPAADFLIVGPEESGVDGLVALFGIESPGVTASLAIADEVARIFRYARPGRIRRRTQEAHGR